VYRFKIHRMASDLGFIRSATPPAGGVDAENHVTSCDPGIFVDQAAELAALQHADSCPFC
jgi:hypothetical protein